MKSKIFSLTVADAGVYREFSNYASELCLDWKKKISCKTVNVSGRCSIPV